VTERQVGAIRAARAIVPRCPPDPAGELPPGHDELLAQQRVLRDERRPSAEQVGGETC
jgi:diadenosine tetraphosphatase ApaH/serine/threonine PP2A family protein phosphatase